MHVDRLEAMSILLHTVEKGSFTAAAKALGMPLPTVSRKVGELEAHLGAQLLLRTTRRLSLTDAGAAYVAASRRILDEVDEAERVVSGEYDAPRGELVLTAPVLFGRLHLLPVVADFLAAYRDITVRLSLSDRNLHLLDDRLDMAVRIGELPDSSMIATRIGSMRTVVCASPKLIDGHGAPKRPEDLSSLPCVSFESLSGASGWTFRRPGGSGAITVAVAPRLMVTTAEAAVWAASQGVGVAQVLHYHCAEAVRNGELRLLLADHEPARMPIHLIHAARGALPLKMRSFLDFATERLRQKLNDLG
jgi:DNA-binding transcriptional LysR family regulator